MTDYFQLILVSIVLILVLVSLYKEILGTAFTFLIASVMLGIFGILSPSEILSGFANEQIAIVVMLLLLGNIIKDTSILDRFFEGIFRGVKTYKGFTARMIFLVGSFSAFLNNTPLVALLMPFTHKWSKDNNIYPSKLLIPLSYAAILGGSITLIGTSTNLIINSMIVERGMPPLNFFDFTIVGLPMFALGMLYLIFFGNDLLPSKKSAMGDFSTNTREYIAETVVNKKSKLIGKNIKEAGLRNLKGLYLFEIIREDVVFSPINHNLTLQAGDILSFTGETKMITDILKSKSGLSMPSVGMLTRLNRTEIVEVVISYNSTLITKTIKEINFRAKYNAAVIAIHRNGERVRGQLGKIKLKAGDVLLILTGDIFKENYSNNSDFYYISKVRDIHTLPLYKRWILLGGFFLAILLAALNIFPLFMTLLVLLLVLNILGIASPKEIPKKIDFNLAIIIALSLSLGTAMIKTGFADLIANSIIYLLTPFGTISILFGIFIITSLLGAYITSKAAVAIVFPIALAISTILGIDSKPFILTVAFAAVANFITPIGYQTNLIVYGSGGYSFKDYFKIGLPLTLIYMVTAVLILNYIYC